MPADFKPVAYLKDSCPFCFKLVMFLAEAGLMDKVEIIRIKGDDEAEMNHYHQLLQGKTGATASFPTMELAPGEFSSDSEGLISHFAAEYGVDVATLAGLAYYKDNLFPAYIARFKELKALKEKLG
ncbi:hypothetical protein [Oceanobacter mangrovi]|uniref:hypothetical protein n=1 Tax=Oceanobacter mangrovi TaxID=2862510 RepID=UPI001C8EDCB2|nr:hypothetical protein [Oceanobacter mangrovi]